MAVKLVTDSTWDLSRELAERWDITVVPCNVHFDDDVYKDGIDIGPDEFYARLASSPRLPTTAQPSVNDFLQVYKGLADQGNDVISIHLSAKLSGTLNSALQAKNALESPEGAGATRIEIIDSQLTSTGLGLVTLAAAQMALAGGSYEEVASKIQDSLPLTHCYFLVDTLEYLQRGGRIGKASAFLGSLLNIKPILTLRDGEAHPAERVRTRERALHRLAEIVLGLAPAEYVSVAHSTTPDDAETLRQRLGGLVPGDAIVMARFGPAIGTYLGPGALGVSLISSR